QWHPDLFNERSLEVGPPIDPRVPLLYFLLYSTQPRRTD
ncbi:unnamed protein product, partial [Heterotrigona itama]